MNKYHRNIKQIEDADKVSSKIYFLSKMQEECVELIQAINKIIELEEEKVNYEGTMWEENFHEELADVMNVITYLKIVFDLDWNKIEGIMDYKCDRGYERGVK